MFSLSTFYFIFLFSISLKLYSRPGPKLEGMTTLTWKELSLPGFHPLFIPKKNLSLKFLLD